MEGGRAGGPAAPWPRPRRSGAWAIASPSFRGLTHAYAGELPAHHNVSRQIIRNLIISCTRAAGEDSMNATGMGPDTGPGDVYRGFIEALNRQDLEEAGR